MNWYAHPESWSFILRRYLPRLAICSLVWEVAQLPLYALRAEPLLERIAYAIAHCTAGDVLIGIAALLLALSLSGAGARASWPGTRIVMWMIVAAVAYTVWSERTNLAQGNWAYSVWMPVLPWIGVGLTPLLQWIVVPLVAWRWANRQR
ncbi:MAG: hypothetical protein AUJ88_02630 [Gallionellaceae bacterium CG1_02_56_997]|nr:MAG: hypothetical protein AUJ88_02630 [Gallionellaceae bacterium CG1_02_56_997]